MKLPKQNVNWKVYLAAARMLGGVVGLASCSKKSDDSTSASTSLSSVSLSNMPSVSSALKSSTSASGFSAQTYTGTPPTLATLGAVDSNGSLTSAAETAIKAAFFKNADGSSLLTTILATNPGGGNYVTSGDRDKFWGQTSAGPGGMGACQMAQGVGEAFGRLLESVTSTCYMKNISQQSFGTGLTQVSGSSSLSTLFTQGASDKWVKVNASSGQGTQNVFIRTFGTSSVAANTYKVSLHFCQNGTVTGYETYTVDTSAGTFTAAGQRSEGSDVGDFSLTAGLTVSGSSIAFDPSVARVAVTRYSGSWGKYKGKVNLSGDTVQSFRWWTDGTSANKDYAKALISGSNMSNFRFLEGGFKGKSTWSGNSGAYGGAVEYSTDRYASVSTNSYYTDAQAYGPGGSSEDSFYSGTDTSLAAPTVDLSSYSCSQAVDDVINFDMTSTVGSSIQTSCEGERFRGYQMCQITDINTAMGKVQQSYGH
jgi:hypothetical protein